MSYLDQLSNDQRALLLKPIDWKETIARLERNLAAAKPKYRAGIDQMLRIARAKAQKP